VALVTGGSRGIDAGCFEVVAGWRADGIAYRSNKRPPPTADIAQAVEGNAAGIAVAVETDITDVGGAIK